ncbi:P-loop containing nucleoside triphosphate hydrolase protein [Flagelloscypha sp. PMI_526]|nr:P-loop containing nucleoside triphosphate hydrolase protein [Flagelloscypha sp. PMI_526]
MPGRPGFVMRHRGHARNRKGEFKVDDPGVKHSTLGVWDLYEEVNPHLASVPGASRLELFKEMTNSIPFVWRMVKDVASIRSCWFLFGSYFAVQILLGFATCIEHQVRGSPLYSGQLLLVVQKAVDERKVDRQLLFEIAAARIILAVVERLLNWANNHLTTPLNRRIHLYYTVHLFHANARLDVPTFNSTQVQQQLEGAVPQGPFQKSVAWEAISKVVEFLGAALQLVSQLTMLGSVLREQRDGLMFASLKITHAIFQYYFSRNQIMHFTGMGGAWAATARDPDYIRMEGLKQTIVADEHRKEIVAGGNMWSYLLGEYRSAVNKLGERAVDFWSAYHARQQNQFSLIGLVVEPLAELPQILFTLRAVQYPASVPVSLGIIDFAQDSGNMANVFASVRKLYEVTNIPNRIEDGTIPYPENSPECKDRGSWIGTCHSNTAGSANFALQNVSFTIQQGQLCVIVGANGSGKSTILKLIARIYDPTEGEILIDGQNIKNLKLVDLRNALACLFQDYTHFPLDIKDNIGVGDPKHGHDMDRIQEAARLAGADGFIEKLSEGYDTYLTRPVQDHYSGLPEGTEQLFGRKVDHSGVRHAGGLSDNSTISLSGGQMQRVALARCFMKSMSETDEGTASVGLLLFDEPSASLDPKAEHDLFQRLRQLRGSKTMLFSSHRFGNLTRHADMILYMDDSRIVETGTHEELVSEGGAYAEIWQLSIASLLH